MTDSQVTSSLREDTLTTVKQLPAYFIALFPIFSSFVCMYSQFQSGSYSNIYVSVNWWRRNYDVIPKIMGYLCPKWSGKKIPGGIYSQDDIR